MAAAQRFHGYSPTHKVLSQLSFSAPLSSQAIRPQIMKVVEQRLSPDQDLAKGTEPPPSLREGGGEGSKPAPSNNGGSGSLTSTQAD